MIYKIGRVDGIRDDVFLYAFGSSHFIPFSFESFDDDEQRYMTNKVCIYKKTGDLYWTTLPELGTELEKTIKLNEISEHLKQFSNNYNGTY